MSSIARRAHSQMTACSTSAATAEVDGRGWRRKISMRRLRRAAQRRGVAPLERRLRVASRSAAAATHADTVTLGDGHALKMFDTKEGEVLDLVIAGAGPAGLAVASRVASQGFQVLVLDPKPLSMWPNNYGVWVDEFRQMGLEEHLDTIWDEAVVVLGESGKEGDPGVEDESAGRGGAGGLRKVLSRPYGRVNRRSLKRCMLEQCCRAGVQFMTCKAMSVEHLDDKSIVSTGPTEDESDGSKKSNKIEGRLVLDATGHSRSLVAFDRPFKPGVQAAYGIMANVKSHNFDLDKMLFMDWRARHLDGDADVRDRNFRLPTFLYAMPFSDTRVFLEETSLVARPGLAFDDLKNRMKLRLEYLGIEIESVEEEEFCFIPMGGVLPRVPQRTLALGGTAGLVHPSTGYMVARTLQAAPQVADAIVSGLTTLKGAPSSSSLMERSGVTNLDELSESVWRTVWSDERLGQREFKVFGMEVLLSLNLLQTRGFFSAFFDLSDEQWQGFLSWRLTFNELILFGLSLFIKSANDSRATLLLKGTPGLVLMIAEILTGNTGTGILFNPPGDWLLKNGRTATST